MTVSREMQLRIYNSLIQLERHVRAAGDNETADKLRTVIESPNQITSLQKVLSKGLQRPRRADNLASKRYAFFSRFRSADGKSLTERHIKRLVSATKLWELEDDCIKQLEICALLWSHYPGLFWYGEGEENIIKRCVNDLRRVGTVDKSKRKVILITLSQTVEQEQGRIRNYGRKRVRDKKNKGTKRDVRSREPLLLRCSLNRLVSDLWPDVDDYERKQVRKCVTDGSRYGWRWSQLENIEMALSLYQIDSNKYETRGWESIEFDALNAFIKTLPQFRIRERLEEAWAPIINYYRNTGWPGSPAESRDKHILYMQQPTVGSSHPAILSTPIPITVVSSRRKKKNGYVSDPKNCRQITSQQNNSDNVDVSYSTLTPRASSVQPTNMSGRPVDLSPITQPLLDLHKDSDDPQVCTSQSVHSSPYVPTREHYCQRANGLNIVQPETQTAGQNDHQQLTTHCNQGSHQTTESTNELVLNPLPSLQSRSVLNDIDWGDYFLPALFHESLPNPLPPFIATSGPAEWAALYRTTLSNTISQPTNCDSLPNPLPPFNATSGPAEWDSLYQSASSNTISQPTSSSAIPVPDPLPPSQHISGSIHAEWNPLLRELHANTAGDPFILSQAHNPLSSNEDFNLVLPN